MTKRSGGFEEPGVSTTVEDADGINDVVGCVDGGCDCEEVCGGIWIALKIGLGRIEVGFATSGSCEDEVDGSLCRRVGFGFEGPAPATLEDPMLPLEVVNASVGRICDAVASTAGLLAFELGRLFTSAWDPAVEGWEKTALDDITIGYLVRLSSI